LLLLRRRRVLLLLLLRYRTLPLQLLPALLQLLGCVCCCLNNQAMDPLGDCRH
jgi:hypothetical protein